VKVQTQGGASRAQEDGLYSQEAAEQEEELHPEREQKKRPIAIDHWLKKTIPQTLKLIKKRQQNKAAFAKERRAREA
jgi:hypothetical protein